MRAYVWSAFSPALACLSGSFEIDVGDWCRSGDLSTVEIFLDRSPDKPGSLKQQDLHGRTALMLAVKEESKQGLAKAKLGWVNGSVVKFLLDEAKKEEGCLDELLSKMDAFEKTAQDYVSVSGVCRRPPVLTNIAGVGGATLSAAAAVVAASAAAAAGAAAGAAVIGAAARWECRMEFLPSRQGQPQKI